PDMDRLLVDFALTFVTLEQFNAFLSDPRTVATLVGALVAISGALLGSFLQLRQISLTTDAISHTILLGIVVAFLVMVGVFRVAIADALLGSFLLSRQMSLTTDATSHTVLLGIVVAFLLMVGVFGLEPDLSSPWLILGAAAPGVATVVLTEAIQRTGIVKADAALGLAFPFLFAVSIILVSRFTEDVHLDTDSVVLGEIGVAWANTNSVCLDTCADVT